MIHGFETFDKRLEEIGQGAKRAAEAMIREELAVLHARFPRHKFRFMAGMRTPYVEVLPSFLGEVGVSGALFEERGTIFEYVSDWAPCKSLRASIKKMSDIANYIKDRFHVDLGAIAPPLPLDAERVESLLCTATAALRDLHCGRPHHEVAAPDGRHGLRNHLAALVGILRGAGIDDDGAWDCDATEGIPVASVTPPRTPRRDTYLLGCAATALREIYGGCPHHEILGLGYEGQGLDYMLSALVAHLRDKGLGADWGCDTTDGVGLSAAPRA
jgi:hypothetical protein